MMKCRICLKTKVYSEFYFNKTKHTTERICVLCSREYRRQHYRKNIADYIEKGRRNKAKSIRLITELVNVVKDVPCADCGRKYPAVCMDLDHRDPSKKVLSVAAMRSGGLALRRVKEEILKCDVVCSNCHRLRTHPHLNPLATNQSKG